MDKVNQPGLGDLLKNRGALIGTAVFLFQQLAGINAIIYFSSDVFAKVSFGRPLPAVSAVAQPCSVSRGQITICMAIHPLALLPCLSPCTLPPPTPAVSGDLSCHLLMCQCCQGIARSTGSCHHDGVQSLPLRMSPTTELMRARLRCSLDSHAVAGSQLISIPAQNLHL